jgi:N-acetylglucosamine-6-sulfatase
MRPNVLRLGFSLVLLLGPSIIVTASPQAVSAAPSKPNVVIILTDDQRYDTLWAMPNVQKDLVGKGMQFNQGFVVNSLCCPSRTSILTGDYSHTTQVWKDSPPYGGFETFLNTGDDQSTLATWLHRDGYRTALFGKYLNGYLDQAAAGYIPPGWDQWNAFDRAGYYNYRLFAHNDCCKQFGHNRSDYSTGVLTNDATSFIQNTKTPFFMYFAPYAPHRPAVASNKFDHRFKGIKPWHPKDYNERDVSDKPKFIRKDIPRFDGARNKAIQRFRRRQYQTLLSADHAVGNIVNTLKDTGQLDNTIIFFMSDNGIAWGENRWTSKKVAYEPSIRIPYVVRYDPLTHSASTDQTHLVLNIDVAPTIAELAGAQAPTMDGQSLVPLLNGSADTWRTDFLIEHMAKNKNQAPPTYCAVRSEHFLYVYYATGEEELYNLDRDPGELRNQVNNANLDLERTIMQARLKELCNPHPPGLHIHSGL